MRRVLIVIAAAALLAASFGAGWLWSALGGGRTAPPASLSERERAFTERMRGVVLDGRFTVEAPERRDGLFEDRYEIAGVRKLDGDRWRFDARIVYGGLDLTVPVVVPVLWAGEVPMIHLVDADLPGVGEDFGATILFHGDRYAGTWSHGAVSGFMLGSISPLDD